MHGCFADVPSHQHGQNSNSSSSSKRQQQAAYKHTSMRRSIAFKQRMIGPCGSCCTFVLLALAIIYNRFLVVFPHLCCPHERHLQSLSACSPRYVFHPNNLHPFFPESLSLRAGTLHPSAHSPNCQLSLRPGTLHPSAHSPNCQLMDVGWGTASLPLLRPHLQFPPREPAQCLYLWEQSRRPGCPGTW